MSISDLNSKTNPALNFKMHTLEVANLSIDALNVGDITSNSITNATFISSNSVGTSTLNVNSTATVNSLVSTTTVGCDILNCFTGNIQRPNIPLRTDWIAVSTGSVNVANHTIDRAYYVEYLDFVECYVAGQIQSAGIGPTILYFNTPALAQPSVNFVSNLQAIGSGTRYDIVAGVDSPVTVFARDTTTDIGILIQTANINLDNFSIKFMYLL